MRCSKIDALGEKNFACADDLYRYIDDADGGEI